MKYAFVLGKNPDISIAELGAVLGPENIEIPKNRAAVYCHCEPCLGGAKQSTPPSPRSLLNRLGGCTEIIEIIKGEVLISGLQAEIEELLIRHCERAKQLAPQTGKFPFAINFIPENKKTQVLKTLLPRVKKSLRASGIRANFMNKDFRNVSAVLAVKQGLVKHGTNVNVIYEGEGKVSLGFSVAMQDFEAYSARDYGKPRRDAQAGMLPPKLAQIMVNLALCHPLILDPFCGTGTILMEALLMGYSSVGSDSDPRMVEAAQKNIEWLRKNFKIADSIMCEISQGDACHCEASGVIASERKRTKQSTFVSSAPSVIPSKTGILSVVTEPHLGPPLSSFPAPAFLDKVINDLSSLYLGFFKNLAAWLPKGTPVVFIFPVWIKNPAESIRLSDRLIEKIQALGYSKTAFDPLQTTSLFYSRPGQIVGREIVRFIKK